MKEHIKKKFILTLSFLLVFSQLFAQIGLPGDEGGCSDPDTPGCETPPEDVPLDNWLIVLVIGGLILTAVYLHLKQKKEASV